MLGALGVEAEAEAEAARGGGRIPEFDVGGLPGVVGALAALVLGVDVDVDMDVATWGIDGVGDAGLFPILFREDPLLLSLVVPRHQGGFWVVRVGALRCPADEEPQHEE